MVEQNAVQTDIWELLFQLNPQNGYSWLQFLSAKTGSLERKTSMNYYSCYR